MKYLRIVLLVYALLALAGAAYFFLKGGENLFLGVYLLISFGVVIIGTFFERKYNPKSAEKSGWVKTGEKFIDEKTGKLTEVHFNSKTGERKYVESEKATFKNISLHN